MARTNVRTLVLGIATVIATASSAVAGTVEPATGEFRRHFEVRHQDEVLYQASVIVRSSDTSDEMIVLARDMGFGDVILHHKWVYEEQRAVKRISDVAGKVYIQAAYGVPIAGKTRQEILAQARQSPALKFIPAVVTIETNGGKWEGLENDWDELSRLRALRHQIRQSLAPYLLEAIERMRGTLFTSIDAQVFRDLVAHFVTYNAADQAAAVSAVTIRETAADCEFDAAFGFACSERQKARIKAAISKGKPLTRY